MIALEAGAEARLEDLENQVFAMQFEQRALAASLIVGKAERWVDGFVPETTSQAHRARYAFACRYVENKRTLDIACGVGTGTRMLAEQGGAACALGVDIDEEAIRYARIKNARERCTFLQASAEEWEDEKLVDVVVSFETIEHLNAPEKMLERVYRCLVPDGLFLVSTPIAAAEGAKPANPYHVQEWTLDGFRALLSKHGFTYETIYYQSLRQVQKRGLPERITRKLQGRSLEAELKPFRRGDLFDSMAPYTALNALPKFQVVVARRNQAFEESVVVNTR